MLSCLDFEATGGSIVGIFCPIVCFEGIELLQNVTWALFHGEMWQNLKEDPPTFLMDLYGALALGPLLQHWKPITGHNFFLSWSLATDEAIWVAMQAADVIMQQNSYSIHVWAVCHNIDTKPAALWIDTNIWCIATNVLYIHRSFTITIKLHTLPYSCVFLHVGMVSFLPCLVAFLGFHPYMYLFI